MELREKILEEENNPEDINIENQLKKTEKIKKTNKKIKKT